MPLMSAVIMLDCSIIFISTHFLCNLGPHSYNCPCRYEEEWTEQISIALPSHRMSNGWLCRVIRALFIYLIFELEFLGRIHLLNNLLSKVQQYFIRILQLHLSHLFPQALAKILVHHCLLWEVINTICIYSLYACMLLLC